MFILTNGEKQKWLLEWKRITGKYWDFFQYPFPETFQQNISDSIKRYFFKRFRSRRFLKDFFNGKFLKSHIRKKWNIFSVIKHYATWENLFWSLENCISTNFEGSKKRLQLGLPCFFLLLNIRFNVKHKCKNAELYFVCFRTESFWVLHGKCIIWPIGRNILLNVVTNEGSTEKE